MYFHLIKILYGEVLTEYLVDIAFGIKYGYVPFAYNYQPVALSLRIVHHGLSFFVQYLATAHRLVAYEA